MKSLGRSLRPSYRPPRFARHRGTGKPFLKGLIPIGLAVVVLSAIAIALKTVSSGRAGPIDDPMQYLKIAWRLVNPNYDWRSDYGLNIFAATEMHFWRPLADWTRSGGGLILGQFNSVSFASAACAAGLSYGGYEPPAQVIQRVPPRSDCCCWARPPSYSDMPFI